MESCTPEVAFGEIYRKAKELGLKYNQLEQLPSIQLIKRRRKGSWYSAYTNCRALIGYIVLAFGLCMYYGLHTAEGFSRVWFYWENIDIHEELCTIEMPPVIQNIFMPPVDCSHCVDLTEVQRVRSITPEEFEELYAYSAVPVIVTDAMVNWSAVDVFSFDFFKTIYGKDSPALSNYRFDCQFFPYETEFRNLSQVFEMPAERANMAEGSKPWYIGWGNCDPTVANILRKHYNRPYFIPQHSEATKMDWIFMGSPGYGAHLHIDKVNNPSWQAQIKGRKLWTLEPLPECYSSCKSLEVIVEPGEIIVLDTNIWYHKTLIVDKEMSITIGSEYD